MKKKRGGFLFGLVVCMVVMLLPFATGSALAQGGTQGEVALNLANMLGLNLPPGASQADAISALSGLGIAPAGGWQANAQASSGFISSLYTSVEAASTAGRIAPTAGYESASVAVAAACTAAGIPSNTVVAAITSAGGNTGQATQGATYGGTYAAAPAYTFGPAVGGGAAGGGGGGGGISPSPSQ